MRTITVKFGGMEFKGGADFSFNFTRDLNFERTQEKKFQGFQTEYKMRPLPPPDDAVDALALAYGRRLHEAAERELQTTTNAGSWPEMADPATMLADLHALVQRAVRPPRMLQPRTRKPPHVVKVVEPEFGFARGFMRRYDEQGNPYRPERTPEVEIAFGVKVLGAKCERGSSYGADPGRWYVELHLEVPDRETGNPIPLWFNNSYSGRYEKHHAIRKALLEFVAHEVDESIYLEGERVFDPHAHEPPRLRYREF